VKDHGPRRALPPSLLLAALLLLAAVILAGTAVAAQTRTAVPAAPTVVRIYYDEIAALERLAAFDLFEYNNLQERYVLAAVTPAELAALREAGWMVAVEVAGTAEMRRDTYFDGYRTAGELYAEMAALAEQYPGLAELVTYGESYCAVQGGCTTPGGEETAGYDLLALRVTNEQIPGASTILDDSVQRGKKPVFFLLANIHARELTTPEIAMRWITLLLEQYGEDPLITWLVDRQEMWIIPTANPDGHWITELGVAPEYGGYPLMHRKNFDMDADDNGSADCPIWPSETLSQFGVDLNRNHSYGWLPAGGASPCAQTYPGPSAASEPEVAALQALLSSLYADQRGPGPEDAAAPGASGTFITLHNYGDLVLRPWGSTSDVAPDEEGLKAIGDKFATFNGYQSCRPPECLYPAHGTTDDWVYGELGVPAFTFEIGDEIDEYDPFVGFRPPYAVIDWEQWPENRDAFLYAARIAARPYALVHGPEATAVSVSAAADRVRLAAVGAVDGSFTVTADLDDRQHGGQAAGSAAFSIDTPFWTGEALPIPLAAADGAADSPLETFAAEFPAAGLAPGRHQLFVSGWDSAGNAGAATAAFFEVAAPPNVSLYHLPLVLGR
jgi:hypothetical protein